MNVTPGARYPHPPATSPVEPYLWAALLEGRGMEVPCHFGSGPAWGRLEVNEWSRCLDVAPDATPEERQRHSAAHGWTSVACSGPAVVLLDLLAYGGGYVPACAAQVAWLEHHGWLDHVDTGAVRGGDTTTTTSSAIRQSWQQASD